MTTTHYLRKDMGDGFHNRYATFEVIGGLVLFLLEEINEYDTHPDVLAERSFTIGDARDMYRKLQADGYTN